MSEYSSSEEDRFNDRERDHEAADGRTLGL